MFKEEGVGVVLMEMVVGLVRRRDVSTLCRFRSLHVQSGPYDNTVKQTGSGVCFPDGQRGHREVVCRGTFAVFDILCWTRQIPHPLNFFLHFPNAPWTMQVPPASKMP